MSDKQPGDLWEEIGSLDEMEAMQVLTKLFVFYEAQLDRDPQSTETKRFFNNLALAVSQVSECNLNRR